MLHLLIWSVVSPLSPQKYFADFLCFIDILTICIILVYNDDKKSVSFLKWPLNNNVQFFSAAIIWKMSFKFLLILFLFLLFVFLIAMMLSLHYCTYFTNILIAEWTEILILITSIPLSLHTVYHHHLSSFIFHHNCC